MFENLTAVAILITLAWLGIIGWYIYLSRRQEALREELDALRELLEKKEKEEKE